MTNRIYNFSSGPAVLPGPVLKKAQEEMLSYHGSGMSVMEMSHRSPEFEIILGAAKQSIRELLSVPPSYDILFMQGGASLQFSMIPMNFLASPNTADYVVTGVWSEKAYSIANRCGHANLAYSTAASAFRSIPTQGELKLTREANYIHYASNETIDGVEFKYDLDGHGVPVVCDASSNILSKPIDIGRYAMIYAGAQKNIGCSGVALVIIHDDFLQTASKIQHPMLEYRNFAQNSSMPNTPNTWGIYMIGLVCDWLKSEGGLIPIQERNEAKAATLYAAIDSSDGYYVGRADRDARSVMNVTFRLRNQELEMSFCNEAAAAGLGGLKGHRSVGGIRASLYNAFPTDGVEELVGFMHEFAARNP